MRTFAIVATITALAVAAVPVAVSAKSRRPVARAAVAVAPAFRAADTNASRTISGGEWQAAGAASENFALVDANANGELGFFEVLRAAVARAMRNRS